MIDNLSNQKKSQQRISKILSRLGICSRRQAEQLVKDGKISIRGQILRDFVIKNKDIESIKVNGKALPKIMPTRIWRYYKPINLLTSNRSENGRLTIFDNLPKEIPRVVKVGRLDINSEGLLLLTNNGEVARNLELPSTKWERNYRVRVYGRINKNIFKKLINGITIDGFHYKPIRIHIEKEGKQNSWLRIILTEGKNREIRKIMNHIGLKVNRLIRTRFGPFNLDTLKPGEIKEVPKKLTNNILKNKSIVTPDQA
jgi:23S rRNA pseudouridine2605 synthase